jgi:hypothetical protein
MIAFVLFIFILLLFIGVSGNYKPASAGIGDVIGGFFTAVSKTFSQFFVVTNTLIFTALFFATEALFVYVYYKIGVFIFRHLPELQGWVNQARVWFKRN